MSRFYMLILALAVRFLHFALFEGTLLSPHYYAVDFVFCLLFGFLGFRVTRAGANEHAISLALSAAPAR